MTLMNDIRALENLMPYAEEQNEAISSKDIAWHIDHCCRVILNVATSLEKSKPEKYIQNVSPAIAALFNVGVIPRGTAQAPPSLMAEGNITGDELQRQLKRAKNCSEQMEKLSTTHHFIHPYFGMLNLEMSSQFLDIHTKHHLKIMEDILALVPQSVNA